VADDAKRLAGGMHVADQSDHGGVASQLVRRPASGHHGSEEIAAPERLDARVGDDLETVLAAQGLQLHRRAQHLGTFLLQAHQRHVVLEILDAFCNQDRNAFTRQSHELLPRNSGTQSSHQRGA
jgi:hypothetical protein